jgi:predicted  nucleic acid-binding Zn-ribbon protein
MPPALGFFLLCRRGAVTAAADLYRLQCLDAEQAEKAGRLREVAAQLGDEEEVKEARAALESAQAGRSQWSGTQRDLDLQVQSTSDKITKSEARLYGGQVTNPKELADLQAEVSSLKRRRAKLEDDLLEAMLAYDSAAAERDQAEEHLTEVENHWSARHADLLTEENTLQDQLKAIAAERSHLAARIDAADLATYEELRKRKGTHAVVPTQGGFCAGCGLAVPPNTEWLLREGRFARCSNCERMLVPEAAVRLDSSKETA